MYRIDGFEDAGGSRSGAGYNRLPTDQEGPFMSSDPFGAIETLSTPLGDRKIARLSAVGDVSRLPYSIRVLLEAALRNLDGVAITESDVKTIASYRSEDIGNAEIPFIPGRVVLQDFTGVPAVVDLAAMRAAIVRMTDDAASEEAEGCCGETARRFC